MGRLTVEVGQFNRRGKVILPMVPCVPMAPAPRSWQTAANQASSGDDPMAAKTSAKSSTKIPARIRHIALCVKDIKATADFYEKAFGLKRTEIKEGKTAWNCYMSDGEINLALLQYKSEV